MAEPSNRTLQRNNFASIAKLSCNFGKDNQDRHSLRYFQARLERLKQLWTSCTELYSVVLYETKLSSDQQEESTKECGLTEDVYMVLQTDRNQQIRGYGRRREG
ncbi:unnamed protein product [Hermetia illucens]|uniref:Uncharacterized protein n=1 Tax=Hermetia illucens TaxID=343691 RepID=A0A7R8UG39_HERIL|nr:unnamed protein product [Hermetia illucens]